MEAALSGELNPNLDWVLKSIGRFMDGFVQL
jgi:hypothetical protein